MLDYLNNKDSFDIMLALIDKKAIDRARLLSALIGAGAILSFVSFLWLWLAPPSDMTWLIFVASVGTISAILSIILVVIYIILLVITLATAKPYVSFPTLTIVKRLLAVKEAFLSQLPFSKREYAEKLLNEWEYIINGGEKK